MLHASEKELISTYRKNLYEWKEDVVRPKLLLGKLCHDRVRVKDVDVRHAFEAHYGEKVQCRIILWPRDAIRVTSCCWINSGIRCRADG